MYNVANFYENMMQLIDCAHSGGSGNIIVSRFCAKERDRQFVNIYVEIQA